MEEIRLSTLRLKNFKGIKSFALETGGGNVIVFGDNATGKTTLYDAFMWILFGKDSRNQADFDIKTIDDSGMVQHGLDHEVEAVLDVNGKAVSLKKIYSEKWTKKRGEARKEFTGHTTDYFVNGVPAKKKEWDAKIAEITDEETFRLLTDPRYFTAVLHWKKRREILLDVCGDVTDEDVIASDEALAKLPEILGGRSLEDHRKVIEARRKEVNKELERLPVRIDEVAHGMPDIEFVNQDQIRNNIEHYKRANDEADAEINRIESGGQAAELKKQLADIEYQIQEQKNSHQQWQSKELGNHRAELIRLNTETLKYEREIRTAQAQIDQAEKEIQALESKAEGLRKQWYKVNSRQFSADDTCPACGQTMPAEIIEQSKARFNKQKATELAEITQSGKNAKSEIEQRRQSIQNQKKIINAVLEKINGMQGKEEDVEAKIQEIQNTSLDTAGLEDKKSELEKQIQRLSIGDNAEAVARAREKIEFNETQIEALQQSLAKIEQHERAKARIEDLKAQEKKLAAEYEEIESQIYLAEQFVRQKVNLLEEKINSRFDHARFRLFEEQINGGLEETCEVLVDGVSLPSANNAAQINIGLDIINTLSAYYGFSCPIWIDNAEAVTKFTEIKSQMIKLVVSEEYPKLSIFKEESCQNRKAL